MSEKSELDRMGAKPQKNSGRGPYQKGDGIMDVGPLQFTVDIKEYSQSFSLSRKVWSKICTDAIRNRGSIPLLQVVLDGKTRLAVIEYDILKELLEVYAKEVQDR